MRHRFGTSHRLRFAPSGGRATCAKLVKGVDRGVYLRPCDGDRGSADAANHTVAADKGAFALGNLNKGRSQSFHFTKAGVYGYRCDSHPFMHGVVIVK